MISLKAFHINRFAYHSIEFFVSIICSCLSSKLEFFFTQLVLAVAWVGGKLGAAYYDIVTHEVSG